MGHLRDAIAEIGYVCPDFGLANRGGEAAAVLVDALMRGDAQGPGQRMARESTSPRAESINDGATWTSTKGIRDWPGDDGWGRRERG